MIDYFSNSILSQEYFSVAKTSSQTIKSTGEQRNLQAINEAKNSLQRTIKSYGAQKPTVVIKRYGIK